MTFVPSITGISIGIGIEINIQYPTRKSNVQFSLALHLHPWATSHFQKKQTRVYYAYMKLGIDCLTEHSFSRLQSQRVGLLSHLAAVSSHGRTTAEILHESVNLVALFGPEHGFLGQALAGETTTSFEHPEWHIPVHSLYGATRRPTPDMITDIDCVVCDLQDLGVRCYTYLATLKNMMSACAEAGIRIIVLDRPIPLPNTVDGPIREAQLDSFVAPAPVPFVIGMTPAESARWMQHHLIPDSILDIVPMEVASRDDIRFDALQHFVPPSPGIRSPQAAMIYPATVFTEAIPSIDCGLGTDNAFTVFGAPWMNGEAFCDILDPSAFPGIHFEPTPFLSAKEYAGQTLQGVRIVVDNRNAFRPFTTGMRLLDTIFRTYGLDRSWKQPSTRQKWFDSLVGVPALREALLAGEPYSTTPPSAYMAEREAILLY